MSKQIKEPKNTQIRIRLHDAPAPAPQQNAKNTPGCSRKESHQSADATTTLPPNYKTDYKTPKDVVASANLLTSAASDWHCHQRLTLKLTPAKKKDKNIQLMQEALKSACDDDENESVEEVD